MKRLLKWILILSAMGALGFPAVEGAGLNIYYAFDSFALPAQTPAIVLSERIGVELPVEETGLTFSFSGGLAEIVEGNTWSWTYVFHPHLIYDRGWGWVDFGGTYLGGLSWTLHLNFKLYILGPGDSFLGYPVHPASVGGGEE